MSDRPLISVITRTMGQPVFLRRVLACLAEAAPPKTQWVIVDDSGDAGNILNMIKGEALAFPNITPVLIKSAARHRAKAMNAGLAAAQGQFIHILDDDDTISPAFYARTVQALEQRSNAAAVAVRSAMVEETVQLETQAIKEIRRVPHFPEIGAISISMMLVQQLTPTCSILFRGQEMLAIGPFCPDLPVCEDYEFLLRFILMHDIMLHDEMLAAFHTRKTDAPAGFQNSDSSLRHAEVDAIFRNALLRRSLANPQDKLGSLLLAADFARGSVKVDRATLMLRKLRIWRGIYRLFRSS